MATVAIFQQLGRADGEYAGEERRSWGLLPSVFTDRASSLFAVGIAGAIRGHVPTEVLRCGWRDGRRQGYLVSRGRGECVGNGLRSCGLTMLRNDGTHCVISWTFDEANIRRYVPTEAPACGSRCGRGHCGNRSSCVLMLRLDRTDTNWIYVLTCLRRHSCADGDAAVAITAGSRLGSSERGVTKTVVAGLAAPHLRRSCPAPNRCTSSRAYVGTRVRMAMRP